MFVLPFICLQTCWLGDVCCRIEVNCVSELRNNQWNAMILYANLRPQGAWDRIGMHLLMESQIPPLCFKPYYFCKHICTQGASGGIHVSFVYEESYNPWRFLSIIACCMNIGSKTQGWTVQLFICTFSYMMRSYYFIIVRWAFDGHVAGSDLGCVLAMCWQCSGYVLGKCWACSGHALYDVHMFWPCVGYILSMCQLWFGYVLVVCLLRCVCVLCLGIYWLCRVCMCCLCVGYILGTSWICFV